MTTSTSTSNKNNTFHLFPYLPWELRARIWELTISPRTVSLNIRHRLLQRDYDDKKNWVLPKLLFTSTPIPAALHACQEARNHLTHPLTACGGANGYGYGYYEKMSSSDLMNAQQQQQQQPWSWEEEERIPSISPYIWVNFEVDMIDIGVKRFGFSGRHSKNYASKIRRVRFKPMAACLAFEVLTPGGVYSFPNVKEAEIDCPAGTSIAGWADHLPWNMVGDLVCGVKDVVFRDPLGKMMTLAEIIGEFPEGRPPGYAPSNN